MSGPELCPKCKGLHFKTASCIVRATKSTASRKDENAMCLYEADAVATKSVHPGEADGTAGVVITQKVISGVRFSDPAGTQALPVDTNTSASLRKDCAGIGLASPAKVLDAEAANIKDAHTPKRGRGRPRTITDMKVYKAMKQREYRARKKNEQGRSVDHDA